MQNENYSNFFSSLQRYTFIAFVLIGLFLRWYALDEKPLHHDESLHYMYSVYPIDNPKDGYYRYDPMLHGPMLYTLQPFIFKTFGISIESSRILPALIGSLTLAVPYLLRSYLCPWSVITSTALLALSPSLVYWSRFFIHDLFVIIGVIFTLYGVLSEKRKNAAFWVSLGLVFQFGAKENCYVTLAIFLGYLIFQFSYLKIFKDQNEKPLINKILVYCKNYKKETLYAIFFFLTCYCYLYTSGFRNLGPIDQGAFEYYFGSLVDGIYRKSIGYWVDQDAIERIKGPFLFHFYVYAYYETAFLFLYFLHLALFFSNCSQIIRRTSVICFLIYLAVAVYHFHVGVEQSSLGTFFKLKDSVDLAGLSLFFFHAVLLTVEHLIKKEYSLAFFGYFFTANMFTYSYLGEKVPWLSQYPIYFGILYFTLYYKNLFANGKFERFKAYDLAKFYATVGYVFIAIGIIFIVEATEVVHTDRVTLGIGTLFLITSFFINKTSKINVLYLCFIFLSIFTLRSSILTNFVYAGDAREVMSQVHTTKEFDQIIRRVKYEITSGKIGNEFSIYAAGEPVWPITAYLQGITGYKYNAETEEFKYMCYMFDTRDTKSFTAPENFEEKEITLRGWWVPEYSTVNLKKFITYVLNHTPWNEPGYSYARMYINHNPTCGSSRMKQ